MRSLINYIKELRINHLRKKARKIFRIELYDNGEYWLTVNGWRIIHNEDFHTDPFKVLLNARERYVRDCIGGEPNALDDLYFKYTIKEEKDYV